MALAHKIETDKQVNEIFMTYDYEKFKHISGNRTVSKNNLARIIQSMKEKHLLSPIIVNSNMEIIDGQHRFEAQKQLNLPVYYFIDPNLTLKDVQRLNAVGKNWGFKDYLDSYCELGYKEYLKVKRFRQDFPDFSIRPSLSLLRLALNNHLSSDGRRKDSNAFSDGNFACANLSRSYELAAQIMQLKPLTELYKSSNFINAFIVVSRKKDFDFRNFKHKVRKYPNKLFDCTNTEKYVAMIEDLYNYRNTNKVNLRF